MITLKQLLKEQEILGEDGLTDIQIIKSFLTLNDLEEECIDLIHELTKSKIGKMKKRQHIIEEWVCILPSKYLYENYDLDTANNLHRLELNYLINGGELDKRFLDWARENIPKIVQPEVYFFPLVDWLADKCIKFQNR